MVKAAVLEGNEVDREILISLELLQSWDLVTSTFPHETISNYFIRKNKENKTNPSFYSAKTSKVIYEREGLYHKLRDPSTSCLKLKEKMIKKYKNSFATSLGPKDRMSIPPVKLEIDHEKLVPPVNHTRPFDVPYHLRSAWEKEIKDAIEGGVLKAVDKATEWSSKAFAVAKQDSSKVRIVADFRQLNKALKRPTWPTESSCQLLRHVCPKSRYYVTVDATSGYHQVPVAEESQKYLSIITQQGKYMYTVTPQGVSSSSDLFNYLTDGDTRFDGTGCLKNCDDWLLFGSTLEEIEKKLTNLLEFCQSKNLKLNPAKLVISEEVEFGGTTISAESVRDEEVIFIGPKSKRIKAFEELKKPTCKREVQVFCGMLASLQSWFPSLPLNIPNLRKATAGASKFSWTPLLEAEFKAVKNIMATQIRLSPYDPEKRLRLVIDGASSIGVGFVLFQYLNDADPTKGACIIQANSSLLGESQVGYSPIDAELIGLDFAARCCHYWLWYCPQIELYSDCSGLLDMLKKPIADIQNRRHQKILIRLQNYNFEGTHIAGTNNRIADALSRLCRNITSTHHYPQTMPRILPTSKRASIRSKQLEILDPMVIELAEVGASDPEYAAMCADVENMVRPKDLHPDSELKVIEGSLQHISVATLPDGNRLLVRDGVEVLVPKPERSRILQTIHADHMSDTIMIRQCKNRIFWPKMRQNIKDLYNGCKQCTEHRISRPQKPNEVSFKDVFSNFFPNEMIECDFAQKGSRDFMLIVDKLTGYLQVFEVKNKSSSEAVRCVKEWASLFGKPYKCKCDFGPGYRETFQRELKEIGIEVIYSSAYNPSSNALVERSVRTLKDLLKKVGPVSQLQLRELVFCANAREQEEGQGSPISRFLGHGVRSNIPNSVNRNVDWNFLMSIRASQHEKRVNKPGKTSKDTFDVDEAVWVQDCRTKKWDKEGIVTSVRTAHDGTIVSYNLLINGHEAIRHRRYLRKKFDVGSDDTAAHDVDLAVSETGIERELPRRSSRHRRLE